MSEITSEALNSIRLRCEARMPFQSSEVLSLIAEVERLRARDAEWQQKAAAWMSTPEAAHRLDGYRELAAGRSE